MTEARLQYYTVRFVTLLAWIWLMVALPFLTDAACNWLVGLALAGSWMLLGVVWLVVPLLAPGCVRARSGRRWWLVAGIAGCLGLCLAFTNVGLVIRVALCEPALSDYATQVTPEGGDFLHDPRRVGLFLVDGEQNYEGVVFLYTSQGFINREGVAYVPAGVIPPSQIPRHHLRHLYGQWYWFCWRF